VAGVGCQASGLEVDKASGPDSSTKLDGSAGKKIEILHLYYWI